MGEGVSGFKRWATGCWSTPSSGCAGGLLGETFDGGLAEYVRLPAHMLDAGSTTFGRAIAEAAALPVAYGTAHRMMLARGADARRGRRC